MCNNTRPDAAAEAIRTLMHALIDISCTAATAEKHITRETEAIRTLMHALIDISCTAATAEKHITRETEYTGAIIPHSLVYTQLTADMALNEAKAILIADCENGGGDYAK
ncbi:hypothetical protein [Escherichia coli]|uniref:hypothetical protein n=1 Tax=Escherichia coli TaxID=562 RepID=UPI00092EFB04|nr:hypothetical protein [Escherichia coli]